MEHKMKLFSLLAAESLASRGFILEEIWKNRDVVKTIPRLIYENKIA